MAPKNYNTVTGTYDYGSIVRALQEQIVNSGQVVKEYPYNYQGITQAIQDLTFNLTSNPGADIGPSPNNGNIVIDENGDPVFNYTTPSLNGDLWFDTRQGRLFIYYENNWYQTNGADGLPIVTDSNVPPSASNLALGQLWYDSTNGVLYIWYGLYRDTTDQSTTTTPSATTVPIWQQLVDTNEIPTTATLPLAGPDLNGKLVEAIGDSNYLPTNFDPSQITHQDDANLYFIASLLALDDQIGINRVGISTTKPSDPVPGQMWYDSAELELSIWYVAPGASYGQWVPTFSAQMQDEAIDGLQRSLAAESATRLSSQTLTNTNLASLTRVVGTNLVNTTSRLDSLQSQISAIPSIDLSPYITTSTEQSHIKDLQNQVDTTKADINALYHSKATKDSVDSSLASLQTQINSRATSSEVSAVASAIPSLTGYATTNYVDSKFVNNNALTESGGTLQGRMVVDKTDIAVPSFDYSTNDWDGRLAHKYRTYCPTEQYATFGTTEWPYEYAWEFNDCEDFCWKNEENGKVASIDKNGIAARKFLISTFGANTIYGRTLTSTIDVGDELAQLKSSLLSLRTNAPGASTLEELKTVIANALAHL